MEGKRHEGKKVERYKPEQITDLVYWSFFVSQGSGLNSKYPDRVHAKIFPVLLSMYPEIGTSARRWSKGSKWLNKLMKKDYEDDDMDEDARSVGNPVVSKYVDKVEMYRDSEAHVQNESEGMVLDLDLDERSEAYKALQYFFKSVAVQNVAMAAPELAVRREALISDLALSIIRRDFEILNTLNSNNPLTPLRGDHAKHLRRAKGNSMLCLYGLSMKRAEYRHFLPQEYQELFEAVGASVRKDILTYSAEDRDRLEELLEQFKEVTGEDIQIN